MSNWDEQYRERRGAYEDLCAEVHRLVERVLDDAGVDIAQVESRTKTLESFAEKVRRKGGKYADPVREITDLAALRVIAYFPADVERIGALLEEHFDVDWENSRRQSGETDPDRFGYRSDHYVVRLSPQRLGLTEYRRFDGLRAEIQVRTVMQHAWAAVDHQLRYKNAEQLPPTLRRRLSKLSALLEVADEQFAAIREEAEALEATYVEEIERGDLSAEIDVISLDAYLRQTGLAARWSQTALDMGYWPHVPGDVGDPGRLASALVAIGVTDLATLGRYFAAADEWGFDFLAALQSHVVGAGGAIVAVPFDVLTFLVLRAARDDAPIQATAFTDPITAALRALRTGGWE